MEFRVRLFQIRVGQAQLPFGGGQGSVAEKILDVAQTGMVMDKMCRAAVTPHVRRDDLLNLSQFGVPLHQRAQRERVQGVAPIGNEDPVGLTFSQQIRTRLAQVTFDCAMIANGSS